MRKFTCIDVIYGTTWQRSTYGQKMRLNVLYLIIKVNIDCI